MKHYKIQADLINKVVGDSASVKMLDGYDYGAEDSVYKLNVRGKLEFSPNLFGIEIQNRAKLMDIIVSVPFGGIGIIVSEKLLKIILKTTVPAETQIFDATVIFREKEWPYKFVYIFDAKEKEIINWEESLFVETTVGGEKISDSMRLSFSKLQTHAENLDKFFSPEKLVLNENKLKADFFRLDYTAKGYYVSEKLKSEIESAGCEGVLFKPMESLVTSFDVL